MTGLNGVQQFFMTWPILILSVFSAQVYDAFYINTIFLANIYMQNSSMFNAIDTV